MTLLERASTSLTITNCDTDSNQGDFGGIPGGSCYTAKIYGCAGEPDGNTPFIARVKINPNGVNPFKGVVFFITGGGGTNWYDNDPLWVDPDPNNQCNEVQNNSTNNCGHQVVAKLNNAGYITVQAIMTEKNQMPTEQAGWLMGSATNPVFDGPRALACRYATLMHFVWTDLLVRAQPVCATGNSGGSAAIAYALTQYGLGKASGPSPVLSFAELTSGPPLRSDRPWLQCEFA